MLFYPGEIYSRYDFGKLFTLRSYRLGVEVGVHQAEWSSRILTDWEGEYHGIDPWADIEDYADQSPTLVTHLNGKGDRLLDRDVAVINLSLFEGRVTFHTCTSQQGEARFLDEEVGWVYLDGNHRYEHVLGDLKGWWRKLAPGGMMCGHDVVCTTKPEGAWTHEVQPAVVEFCNEVGADCFLVPERGTDLPWSYYIIK